MYRLFWHVQNFAEFPRQLLRGHKNQGSFKTIGIQLRELSLGIRRNGAQSHAMPEPGKFTIEIESKALPW